MYNRLLKSMNKKRTRILLSITMVLSMIFSFVPDAFALGNPVYVIGVSFNGSNNVSAVNIPGTITYESLSSSSFPEAYQKVPVDTTFTFTFSFGRVYLNKGSYDPAAPGTISTTVMNRDLVQIQDVDGNVIPEVTVSNLIDSNPTVQDKTVQVHPGNPLKYDTNYKLVVKKYFSNVNQLNILSNYITEDVVIPFKTAPLEPASDTSQNSSDYALGTTIPLTQGNDVALSQGVKISSVSLNTPGEGEANTVTVRNSLGETLPVSEGVTFKGFLTGDENYVRSAGGVYGFSLKGAGVGENNHVKITIPYELPANRPNDIPSYAVLDDSKVGIFMLDRFNYGDSSILMQYWKYLPTTIDSTNHTATVDITGFDINGKDIILGAKYGVFPPQPLYTEFYARTATSISMYVSASTYYGTREVVIQRVNHADPSDVKTVTIYGKDYPELLNVQQNDWAVYTDNDVKPGVNYDYTVLSATDVLGNQSWSADLQGNISTGSSAPRSATVDSLETLVKETQDSISANLQQIQNTSYYQPHIVFSSGDSQNSVTKQIELPYQGFLNFGKNKITWTSDRPDILKIEGWFTEVHPPVDAKGNPIKEGVIVNLTGTISYSIEDNITHQTETAEGTVVVPLTVKWNIVNDEVIIDNALLDGPTAGSSLNTDPTIDINRALNFNDSSIKSIILKNSVILSDKSVAFAEGTYTSEPVDYVIDGHGKTLKAGFDGALFEVKQCPESSFTLKNAVIDMNHMSGPVLTTINNKCKITFENVKIINAENCQSSTMLPASVRNWRRYQK